MFIEEKTKLINPAIHSNIKHIIYQVLLLLFSIIMNIAPSTIRATENLGASFLNGDDSNDYLEALRLASNELMISDSDIIYSVVNGRFESVGVKKVVTLYTNHVDGVSRISFELRFVEGKRKELMDYYNKYFTSIYYPNSIYATRSFLLICEDSFLTYIYEKEEFSAPKENYIKKIEGLSTNFQDDFSLVDSLLPTFSINEQKSNLNEQFFSIGYSSMIPKKVFDSITTSLAFSLLLLSLFFGLTSFAKGEFNLGVVKANIDTNIKFYSIMSFVAVILSFINQTKWELLILFILIMMSLFLNIKAKGKYINEYI